MRPLDEFLDLLARSGVELLVDVRALPRSRRHPQFGAGPLERGLAARGIRYLHRPDLGGLRTPREGSRHRALRAPALRAYADHMEGPAFAAALDEIERLAEAGRVALMCAEADWRRCHRAMIADALVVRRRPVGHITPSGRIEPHRLTRTLRVGGGSLIYDAGPGPRRDQVRPRERRRKPLDPEAGSADNPGRG